MNAKQIIERYKAGERNFQRLNLRGMNFKGADLSGSDFSECNLCGTNFENTSLNATKFSRVKCGLPKISYLFLFILSILIILPCSLPSFFVSSLLYNIFDFKKLFLSQDKVKEIIESAAIISFYFFIAFTNWKKGLATSITISILLFLTGVLVMALHTSIIILNAFFRNIVNISFVIDGWWVTILLFISSFLMASEISAIAFVLALATTNKYFVMFSYLLTISSSSILMFSAFHIFGEPLALTEAIIQIFIVATSLAYWLFISFQVWKEDTRDSLIRSLAIAYSSIGGTCFRGADLTDADFTGATLKSTDFREATLVRTIWKDAVKLDQVRFGTSYLGIKKIRELLRSGKADSEDKNYNRLVNLQGLNLAGFNLTDTNFSGSDLSDSNLQSAILIDANLITTNLNDANLKDADLSRAKLVQTQLDNTDLTGATLTGACIEDWGITVYTVLNGIHCDYVYMRFIDGDKRRRKPDGEDTNFAEGEFVEFIKPLIDTLDLYHRQVKDPRTVALALKKLQEEHPEAEIEPISWERRGKNGEDIMIRARISEKANPSQLHAAHFEEYDRLQTLPPAEIHILMAQLQEKEKTISILEGFVDKALSQPKTYVANNQGDVMTHKEDRSVSVGGNAGFAAAGDIKDVNFQGTMNLGQISGNVTNAINQLPDRPADDQPNIKELLSQLQAAIAAETELSENDKADALEQIRTFAEAAQNPTDADNQKLAKTASRILKGILAELPTFTAIAKQAQEYLPLILTFFGL